ncbi:glutamine synthetase [Synchytrium microbalum]|uniref:Glutamine synthetase n=1 Tax=Synchytrium microbalum TaxID=1806994 RepID=A0A507C740_9FUNG|nr:glutamine synthetase [Synchytrium microbalum]TPX35432.1 glutamine synthetase [Synchytrium microbalum]
MDFKELLAEDKRIKLSGADIDGTTRGKIVIKDKFLKSLDGGFGFCDVIFGWDILDRVYDAGTNAVSNAEGGFQDVIAKVDVNTMRRVPWENNVPHFLVDFHSPTTGLPLPQCPRGQLKRVIAEFAQLGLKPMCGMEYEFFCFKETPDSLEDKQGVKLQSLDPGMFGYSFLRPTLVQDWFYEVYDKLAEYDIPIEGWHTETGPGVYEAAIQYSEALLLADRAHLFKTAVKQISLKHSIIPSFMAKPFADQPGCSGHIHISLADIHTGENKFVAPDWKDHMDDKTGMSRISPIMKHFLAGLLEGIPSIMPCLAPTVNSYKRFTEGFWAPVTATYGFENRITSVRLIGPPSGGPGTTRLELRIGGADCNAYLALAAALASGLRGVKKQLELPFPPAGDASESLPDAKRGGRLPKNLKDATDVMMKEGSIAREVMGDEFIDHFGVPVLALCTLPRIQKTIISTMQTTDQSKFMLSNYIAQFKSTERVGDEDELKIAQQSGKESAGWITFRMISKDSSQVKYLAYESVFETVVTNTSLDAISAGVRKVLKEDSIICLSMLEKESNMKIVLYSCSQINSGTILSKLVCDKSLLGRLIEIFVVEQGMSLVIDRAIKCMGRHDTRELAQLSVSADGLSWILKDAEAWHDGLGIVPNYTHARQNEEVELLADRAFGLVSRLLSRWNMLTSAATNGIEE